MISRLRARNEWKFFTVLPKAAPGLATVWWVVLLLRGALPALFAISMGVLVGAVQQGDSLGLPLALTGSVFVALQVLSPIHQAVSANLGSRTATWLNDRLMRSCVGPPGMAHLERPSLAHDLAMARDFDLGISGPPLAIALDFIAIGLVDMVGGIAQAIVLAGFAWWAPLVLGGAWGATHWLLRESSVWRDRNTDEVREAQRHADYAYRLAVDPPAAKELRLFGLSDWTVEKFASRRRRLFELQWRATRLRERSVIWSLVVVLGANALVFWSLADAAASGSLSLARLVVFATAAVGTSSIAFGGLNWALDGASQPVGAALRLDASMARIGALPAGALARRRTARARDPAARPHVRVRSRRATGARWSRPDHSVGDLARDRRAERRGQDDVGQAAVPALRPATRCDRDRRDRPPRVRARRVACTRHRGVPGLHPLRAVVARQRGAARRRRRRDP